MKTFFYQVLIYLVLCTLLVQHVQTRIIIQGRIISGRQAVLGQFPWHVLLKQNNMDDLLCGASIISNSWVLTAAHCTYSLRSIYLVFGTIHLDNNATSMTSNQIYIHPDYNSTYLRNDVSLIKLPTPLNFTRTIQPIGLVTPASSTSFIGSTAVVTGFGITEDEYLENSKTLLSAKVKIINNSDCVTTFGRNIVLDSTMCAKGDNDTNQSICSNDSGGPLVIQTASGTWMQIGINAFVAQDMCTESYPSGYTRLSSYLDYIYQTTGLTLS